MPRAVPEWIADHDDQAIPPRVKARVLEKQDDCCYDCSREFSERLKPEFDHVIALTNGGEHREANLQALCPTCHAKKTGRDVQMKAARAKQRRQRFGLEKKRSSFPTARNGKYKQKIGGKTVLRADD